MQSLPDKTQLFFHRLVNNAGLGMTINQLGSRLESKVEFLCNLGLISPKLLSLYFGNDLTESRTSVVKKQLVLLESKSQGCIKMRHDLINPRGSIPKPGNFPN